MQVSRQKEQQVVETGGPCPQGWDATGDEAS